MFATPGFSPPPPWASAAAASTPAASAPGGGGGGGAPSGGPPPAPPTGLLSAEAARPAAPASAEAVSGAWRHVKDVVREIGREHDLFDLLAGVQREATYQFRTPGVRVARVCCRQGGTRQHADRWHRWARLVARGGRGRCAAAAHCAAPARVRRGS